MKWRLDIISRNQVEFYLPKTGPGLNGLERTSLVNLVWQGGEGKKEDGFVQQIRAKTFL